MQRVNLAPRRFLERIPLAIACLLQLALQAATAAPPPPQAPAAHFHHVHLNATDPKATIAFYKKFFGANDVRYRGLSDGLFSEKSFILLTKVTTPPPIGLGTSLWHIGWAGVDGPSEFAWRTKEGIGVQTPVTPFGSNYYMYFWGPDHEVIEIWTASNGLTSFFVRGPDGLLVEIVAEAPVPEGIWQGK